MEIKVKRGDTLSFVVIRKDEDGNFRTGETNELHSQLRDSNDILYGEFIIAETATLGYYSFSIPAAVTKLFPIGKLYFDIEHIVNEVVQSSDTGIVVVIKDVTKWPL